MTSSFTLRGFGPVCSPVMVHVHVSGLVGAFGATCVVYVPVVGPRIKGSDSDEYTNLPRVAAVLRLAHHYNG